MIIKKEGDYELRGCKREDGSVNSQLENESDIEFYSIYHFTEKDLWQCFADIDSTKEIAETMFDSITKKYYMLYGKAPVDVYYNEGFEELVKQVESEDVHANLYVYSQGDDLNEVLTDYDGWDGFEEITEDQYNTLMKYYQD